MNTEPGFDNGVDPAPLVIRLGRRKSDIEIVMHWHTKRGIVKCNLAYIQGNYVFLEEVPTRLIPNKLERDLLGTEHKPTYTKIQMGIVLVNREWGNVFYFVNERTDWKEKDYFDHAEKLIAEKKKADEHYHKGEDL